MEYDLETVTKSFEKYTHLRFPLKIWILVNANRNGFIYWDESKTIVVVNRNALEAYLASERSIFRCTKLCTFYWLMDFHGFQPILGEWSIAEGDDKSVLRYRNHSFTSDNRAYFEQLLRSRKLREVVSSSNGNCSTHQPRILGVGNPSDLGSAGHKRLSSWMFAQEKFNLLVEMKSLELSLREAFGHFNLIANGTLPIIEVPSAYCDDPTDCLPEYMEQRNIAGNYGNVGIDELNRFFGNYRPVFEDAPESFDEMEEEKHNPTGDLLEVQTKIPALINTLDTFDYQPNAEFQHKYLEPMDYSVELPLDMPMQYEPKDENAPPTEALDKEEVQKFVPKFTDAQNQLCSELRETLELLNEF